MLSPLVTELEHCAFDLCPDLKTLGVCRFGRKDAILDSPIEEVCTLLAADFHKGCLAGAGPDNSPVTAGKVGLAGDFHLAAAAVAAPPIPCLFKLIHGDAFVTAFVLDNELALVDLFLVNRLGIDTKFIGDHLSCGDRADRTTAVDADHDDIVKVDLLSLGKLIECHRVASLDGDTDLHVACAVEVFLDELWQQQGTAVE